MSPRAIALGLGLGFAALTALELAVGDLSVGGVTLIERTTRANLLHWAAALVGLGGYFAGPGAVRLAARVLGVALLALGVWGLVSSSSLGGALGFADGVPATYQVLHGATGLLALFGGFAPEREKAA